MVLGFRWWITSTKTSRSVADDLTRVRFEVARHCRGKLKRLRINDRGIVNDRGGALCGHGLSFRLVQYSRFKAATALFFVINPVRQTPDEIVIPAWNLGLIFGVFPKVWNPSKRPSLVSANALMQFYFHPTKFTILGLPRGPRQNRGTGIQPVLTTYEEGAAQSSEAANSQVTGWGGVAQTSHTVLWEVWQEHIAGSWNNTNIHISPLRCFLIHFYVLYYIN